MITSYNNRFVREVIQLNQKAKARNKQGLFVAEGIKMFAEAPLRRIEKVYISQRMEKELYGQYGERLNKLSCEIVADDVFDKMSDTKTPQGILCLIKQFQYNMEEMLNGRRCTNAAGVSIVMNMQPGNTPSQPEDIRLGRKKPDDHAGTGKTHNNKKQMLFILLENLQDPGNLGTIFRTGEGAGVDGIIMSGQTADIYNPKTIRSTMGSVYRVPFLYTDDICGAIHTLQAHGVNVYAAHLKADKYYDEYDYRGSSAFLIGNEGNGLSEEAAGCADAYLKIPMKGSVESLNAAVASSILLYEVYRQQRVKS
ncbi:MAG: RNA methyltransferase [Lachnospiraceae bacterium]|nr:RNA methyltransferase [Lachnospiraceae bacterium]